MSVIIEGLRGGYTSQPMKQEYDKLKQLTAILISITANSVLRNIDEPIDNYSMEIAAESVINEMPEELRSAAWDAWYTKPKGLV